MYIYVHTIYINTIYIYTHTHTEYSYIRWVLAFVLRNMN